jgi:AraC-like DNA-binding protein
MAVLDLVARGSAIVLMAVIGGVVLRASPRRLIAWSACGLFASISAYLVVTSPDAPGGLAADPILRTASLATPATFWFFTRAFFGDEERVEGWSAAALAAIVAVGFLRPAPAADILYYLGTLALVGMALMQVVRGLSADLVEPRRRMRALFTLIVGIDILAVLGAELWLRGTPVPRELELVKSAGSLGLTLAFGAWILTPRADLIAPEPARRIPAPSLPAPPPDPDARFRDRLLATMNGDRLYQQEGLTLGSLAARLDVPEYRLRRIINQQLGHRNFNAFLNDLRIAEACRVLADPANERLPIYDLAVDLGYGSLGPFNRAFRARTGLTPTEFRRARLNQPGSAREGVAES